MDIDVSQLPALAAEAILLRHEPIRVMQGANPVATVVPMSQPRPQSLQAFRDRIAPLDVTFAELLRQERDEP